MLPQYLKDFTVPKPPWNCTDQKWRLEFKLYLMRCTGNQWGVRAIDAAREILAAFAEPSGNELQDDILNETNVRLMLEHAIRWQVCHQLNLFGSYTDDARMAETGDRTRPLAERVSIAVRKLRKSDLLSIQGHPRMKDDCLQIIEICSDENILAAVRMLLVEVANRRFLDHIYEAGRESVEHLISEPRHAHARGSKDASVWMQNLKTFMQDFEVSEDDLDCSLSELHTTMAAAAAHVVNILWRRVPELSDSDLLIRRIVYCSRAVDQLNEVLELVTIYNPQQDDLDFDPTELPGLIAEKIQLRDELRNLREKEKCVA